MSGIPDAKGRVGHDLNRIEAETMQSDGYTAVDVTPWETASGGKAVICNRAAACTLTTKLDRAAGIYNIAVQYFDIHPGTAQYELLLDGKPIAHWTADNIVPPAVSDKKLDGHTSTRFTVHGVKLAPGDTLMLSGVANGAEPAPVDYIEITRP
jgi:alpha-glucuronidase